MKRRLLFIPLISLIALPSCGNKTSGNKKGDVVSNAVLKANTKAIKKNIFSDFSLEEEFASLIEEETLTVSNGFVIRNNGEQISFFSTLLRFRSSAVDPCGINCAEGRTFFSCSDSLAPVGCGFYPARKNGRRVRLKASGGDVVAESHAVRRGGVDVKLEPLSGGAVCLRHKQGIHHRNTGIVGRVNEKQRGRALVNVLLKAHRLKLFLRRIVDPRQGKKGTAVRIPHVRSHDRIYHHYPRRLVVTVWHIDRVVNLRQVPQRAE